MCATHNPIIPVSDPDNFQYITVGRQVVRRVPYTPAPQEQQGEDKPRHRQPKAAPTFHPTPHALCLHCKFLYHES